MTALYRHFDADGVLLYVGIARSVTARFAQHEDSPWDDLIASITVERFATREEAEAAEREAIKAEKPIHNRMHNAPPGKTTTAGIVAMWPSRRELADDCGVSLAAVNGWAKPSRRDVARIPGECVYRLVMAAQRRGIPLTFEDMAEHHAKFAPGGRP